MRICLLAALLLIALSCDDPGPAPTVDRATDARADASPIDGRPAGGDRAVDLLIVDRQADRRSAEGLPGPDFGKCPPVVAKAAPDPFSVRAPGVGFGGLLTQKTGAYTDVFLKSPTDYSRVGARLEWGGTVVFFGLSANPASNVIDQNDTGRELQLALYDPTRALQGCAYNASCQSGGTACETAITYLGWNPVQGGDECGHGGQVLSHGQHGDGLRLVVRPVQWNPDWNQSTCVKSPCPASGLPVMVTYTFDLRFLSEHVVEVASEVSSQESISHPPTGQEFPTLYVSHGKGGPDLPLLLDAAGNTVSLNTKGNDGFYYDNFTSSQPWVSWQNASKTYGVGLAMDQGITKFQGWRGDGVTAPYFHNVRAQISFGLDAGKSVRGLSYLALGSFATVKAELTAALKKRPPMGWVDAPAPGPGLEVTYAAGQALTVAGWVLDSAAVSTVSVELDGKSVATLPVNKARPDVCAVYPGYGGCPAPGFSGQVPTTGLSDCPSHLLRVRATDADGNSTVLGERRLLAKP